MSIILLYMPAGLLCCIGYYLLEALQAWHNRPRRIVTTGLPPKASGRPAWRL